MNTFRFFIASLFLLVNTALSAQSPSNNPVKALNNYVQFTNESIHGLMIVHRILENLNQEVNKYVDLQSNQFNFYGNKDLPKNVFLDPEQFFYEISPYTWYQTAKAESHFLKPNEAKQLNGHLERLKKMIDRANAVRFELENFINGKDLQKEENQTEIFRQMEACADLYENFYLEKENFRKTITKIYQQNYYKEVPYKSLGVPVLQRIHNNILTVLKSLRYEVKGTLSQQTKLLEKEVKELNEIINIQARYKMAKDASNDFLQNLKKFQSSKSFNKNYKLYGQSYFYHNVELVASLNKYSGGMVKATNEMILAESKEALLLLEEPHIYKVIYPKKEIQRVDNQPVIKDIPEAVNNRNVVVHEQSIVIDKQEFTLQIFDHKEIDGDIISINYNGKWIIEKQELKRKPFKFKVKLNPQGENYLLLHAENMGKTPPNTAAIIYFVGGKRKQVVLNSNMNESEMIRLEFEEAK